MTVLGRGTKRSCDLPAPSLAMGRADMRCRFQQKIRLGQVVVLRAYHYCPLRLADKL